MIDTDKALEKARLLNDRGLEFVEQKKYEMALDAFNDARELFNKLNDRHDEALQIQNIGSVYRDNDEPELAMQYYKESLEIFKEIGHKQGEANQLSNIAYIYYIKENYQAAVEHFMKAELIYNIINDTERASMAKQNVLILSEKYLSKTNGEC